MVVDIIFGCISTLIASISLLVTLNIINPKKNNKQDSSCGVSINNYFEQSITNHYEEQTVNKQDKINILSIIVFVFICLIMFLMFIKTTYIVIFIFTVILFVLFTISAFIQPYMKLWQIILVFISFVISFSAHFYYLSTDKLSANQLYMFIAKVYLIGWSICFLAYNIFTLLEYSRISLSKKFKLLSKVNFDIKTIINILYFISGLNVFITVVEILI